MATPDPSNNELPEVDLVRRRLLMLSGRYVAPAIITSLWLHQEAYGQPMASCMPNQVCQPFTMCPPAAMNP